MRIAGESLHACSHARLESKVAWDELEVIAPVASRHVDHIGFETLIPENQPVKAEQWLRDEQSNRPIITLLG